MDILTILGIILLGILAIRLWKLPRVLLSSKPVVGRFFSEKSVYRFMDPFPGRYTYRLISGELRLPRRIYVGDSHNISLSLQSEEQIVGSVPSYEHLEGTPFVELKVEVDHKCKNFLEAELQAATATISGERIQRAALPSRKIFYRWNCYFQNSGNHEVCIILRSIRRSPANKDNTDEVLELGAITEKVRVVKFDGLTQQQVWVLATVLGIISGLLALIKILHELGLWRK